MKYFTKKSSSKGNANASQAAFFPQIVNSKLGGKIGKISDSLWDKARFFHGITLCSLGVELL